MSSTFLDNCQARMSDAKWAIWQKILCTEIDGNQPFPSGGDQITEPEGDNYVFGYIDPPNLDPSLLLKDEAGNWYLVFVSGDSNAHDLVILLSEPVPANVQPAPIQNNQNNVVWGTDNNTYFASEFLLTWHKISADLDVTLLVPNASVLPPFAAASDGNTFNLQIATIAPAVVPSLYFKHIATGTKFKPWIVVDVVDIDGVPTDVYTLTLEQV